MRKPHAAALSASMGVVTMPVGNASVTKLLLAAPPPNAQLFAKGP